MILLVSFLSVSVAVSIIWIGFILSFLSSGTLPSHATYIVGMMGLFLPLVVIVMSVAFVFLTIEMKKNQLILRDWITALKRDVLNDPAAVHAEIGALVVQEMERSEAPAVMNISKEEPITKYQNLELPDDVELRFKG